jgi:hypothetical protein
MAITLLVTVTSLDEQVTSRQCGLTLLA